MKYFCELTLACQRSAEPVWSRLDLDELDYPDSNPWPCQSLPCLDTFSIHPYRGKKSTTNMIKNAKTYHIFFNKCPPLINAPLLQLIIAKMTKNRRT